MSLEQMDSTSGLGSFLSVAAAAAAAAIFSSH
jgi:hypothetical protein